MREIRFSVDRDWARAAHGEEGFEGALPVTNSWGGWPSAVGIAPYLTLRIVVSGMPHPVTGYLVNIRELDLLLREHAIPQAARGLREHGVGLTGERLVRDLWTAVAARVPVERASLPADSGSPPWTLESLRLWTTPHLSYAIHAGATAMIELSQCFEFSAAHRLHVAEYSDEENRRVFGKCNNPRGHGHNYQVEVAVTGEVSTATGTVAPLPQFESIVKREVIDRLDHKHLNEDVPQFKELNPSVENIARVVFNLLKDKLAPARLRRVRVWETAKTWAEVTA